MRRRRDLVRVARPRRPQSGARADRVVATPTDPRRPTDRRRRRRRHDHDVSAHHDRRRARRAGLEDLRQGDTAVRALDGVDVEFEREQFTAIMGPSGSGKSTLLHCIAGLDRSTSGRGVPRRRRRSAQLSEKELTQVRRDKIGFVFQAFNLIPTLTAIENITLPMSLAGRDPDQAWLDRVIDTVGPPRPSHAPAVRALRRSAAARRRRARARVRSPRSSSPTSPPATSTRSRARRSSTFMRQAVVDFGQTIVMVTHDPIAAVVRGPRRVPRRRSRSSTRCATRPPTPSSTRCASSATEVSPRDVEGHPQGACRAQAAVPAHRRSR